MNNLHQILASVIQKAVKPQGIPPIINQIMNDTSFKDTYEKLPREHKRKLWQSIIQRIELGRRPDEKGTSYKDIRIYFY